MKKLPNSKSLEELLKDLDDPNESTEQIQIEENSILTFLSFYNIEPGKERIRNTFLYRLYKQFTKDPKSPKAFHRVLYDYIPFVEEFNDDKFYLINQKVLNLSKRVIEFLKKDDKSKLRKRATSWKFHFDNFVDKYDIKPGDDKNFIWVSFPILYNMYDKWTYEIKKNNRLSLEEFRRLCQIYLNHKESKKTQWFKVNNSITKYISREMDKKLKARNRSPNETKEKKPKK